MAVGCSACRWVCVVCMCVSKCIHCVPNPYFVFIFVRTVRMGKGLKEDREHCSCYHIYKNTQLYRQLKNCCFIYSIALTSCSIVNWLALDFTCKCHVSFASFARTNCLYLIKCISFYCTAHSLSLMLMLFFFLYLLISAAIRQSVDFSVEFRLLLSLFITFTFSFSLFRACILIDILDAKTFNVWHHFL